MHARLDSAKIAKLQVQHGRDGCFMLVASVLKRTPNVELCPDHTLNQNQRSHTILCC